MIEITYKPDCCENTGNAQGDHRFTLEQSGNKVLFVIGLNPSIANQDRADATMRRILCFAGDNDYDGYVMFNLSSERSTDKHKMAEELNEQRHLENLDWIKKLTAKYPNADILFAYGNGIETRDYLKNRCLPDIVKVFCGHKGRRFRIGELTKQGNPRHPLWANRCWKFVEYTNSGIKL